MFLPFLQFELSYRLKGLMVWIFLGVLTAIMLVLLLTNEPVLEDVFFGNTLRNSPFVIFRLYGMAAVFGCLMVTAFVNSAASRDFTFQTAPLIFSKPISKFGYLAGRFLGAMTISLLPMLGCSLAVFLAPLFSDDPRWGPTLWSAHAGSILWIAIPNTFFLSAVVFAIAVWTRSALASFLGILALMVLLSISGALLGSLASEKMAALADPFGDTALATVTRYWTIAEKNTQSPGLEGVLLWNRLLWSGIGLAILLAACFRFSFSGRASWIGRMITLARVSVRESLTRPPRAIPLPVVTPRSGAIARLRQLVYMTAVELRDTARNPIFVCLIPGVVLAVVATLSVESGEGFGLSSIPVTFRIIDNIQTALAEFQIVLITFFAGVFVWKERDARVDEIFDALPFPAWIAFASKLLALLVIVALVFVLGIASGVLYQLASQYYHIQWQVYGINLLVMGMLQLVCLVVLAVLCHVLSPNKYIGYFVFIGLLVANAVIWPLLEIETVMVRLGALPDYTYSDMFGLRPYAAAIRGFALYWGLLAAVLGTVAVIFWQRGRERGLVNRLRLAGLSGRGGPLLVLAGLLLAWIGSGVWVYWNTQVLNQHVTQREQKTQQAEYELKYGDLARHPQPRVTRIRYDIDLFPEQRRLQMRGVQTLVNQENEPLETVYVTTFDPFETEVAIANAVLTATDERRNLLTFTLNPPLPPEAACEMTFTLSYAAQGFENSLRVPQIVQNGSFFNNQICPQIGYTPSIQLTLPGERENYGLDGSSYEPLDRENLVARRNHYLSHNSDWVEVETVISTSSDQIAVAPGSLQKRWKADGRNYFHYRLDHRSLNFYSFVSGRYKVARERWKDVDIEVYFHPEHQWNVSLMLRTIRRSLEYYTEAFGPYPHRQARIIEFPRVAFFAQAFPGTMPYSEGAGFIADLKNEDDIDMVFYVVAHEVAHQWWAHQVIGANMQGATLLSETLAQYSALMVMEQEYGRDMMRKFLRYEMDQYLRTRGSEKGQEFPLIRVGFSQGYIHYNKGSVAMYHLKETIGEPRVNAALRTLVDRFAYTSGPYPTSLDLLDALREQTPEPHQGLLTDLFEKITLFENRTTRATATETPQGKYQVRLDVEFRKLHAGPDGEEVDAPLGDWIEIGAFAKPPPGRQFGKTLHRERCWVDAPAASFQFTVDEKPHLAGVDPFSLLIDRNTTDNLKTPEVARDR